MSLFRYCRSLTVASTLGIFLLVPNFSAWAEATDAIAEKTSPSDDVSATAATPQETPKGDNPVAESGHATKGPVDEKHESGHDEHKGGHHDEFDLAHANASSDLRSPAAFSFDLSIYTFIVFLLLLAILGKFAWKPITDGLDARENSIANMIAEAKRNQEETASKMKEYEARLAKAAEEARDILGEARREGEKTKDKILAEALAASEKEKERAIEEIRQAKEVALHEIAQKSVNTAFQLAGGILKREVKPQDHETMVKDALSQFVSAN